MLSFFDPLATYGTQETLTAIKALTFESLEKSLTESLKGKTRQELYNTIPKSLSQWNERLDHPDSAFITIKVMALSAVIAAFILPVPLALLGGIGGNFGLAIYASCLFGALITGALVTYLVTNHFQHKFMNRDLTETEITATKNKIKQDLQKRIHNDAYFIASRLPALEGTDLTTLSPRLQNQFESMYLLSRFMELPLEIKEDSNFHKFLTAKNYTNL